MDIINALCRDGTVYVGAPHALIQDVADWNLSSESDI
jgi:hypothetical protein